MTTKPNRRSFELPYERRIRIAALVQERGMVSVRELSALCGVSPLTIRRDLEYLEVSNHLRRTRGGALALAAPLTQDNTGISPARREAITERVDALILTPASPKAARTLQRRAALLNIPVIAEAHDIEGAVTLVTIDNFQAGLQLGRWAGQYLRNQGRATVQAVTISAHLDNAEARRRGFSQGLLEEYPTAQIVLNVFGDGMRDIARDIMGDVLSVHPRINVIFAINDAMLHGALDAYRAAGLDDRELVALTIGLEGQWGKQLLASGGPCKAGVAMFPEIVGRACVDAAICAFRKVSLPPQIVTPSAVVTADTLSDYYELSAGEWHLRWEAIDSLRQAQMGSDILRILPPGGLPMRIGFVYSFGTHEWYQNVLKAMQERAAEYGIELEAVDASENLLLEMEELKLSVARTAARCVEEGDTIILDSGSTITHMAEELANRRNLTVVTNSIGVVTALNRNQNITLMSTGGLLQPKTGALVGPTTLASLANVRVDKAFVSASSVNIASGLYAPSTEEAAVKQAMIRAAREVFLVVDHTKFGEEFMIWFAPVSAVTTIVTDDALPARDRVLLNQAGIRIRTG